MAQERSLPFAHYQRAQRERLQARARASEWQAILARGDALRQWKADTKVPPPIPGQQASANEYLRQRNAERVKKLMRQGVTDEKRLVDAIGDWEAALAGDDRFPIVFLGLVVTLDCFFLPRCLYCNQTWLPRRLTLDDWKALLREAAEPIAETIPSPTRAMMVSSVAPPTNRSMLARTVTLAIANSWIPSAATAPTLGVSITRGLTDIATASYTSRPARSIAAARWKSSAMFALSAEMSARATRSTFPPAR